VARMNMVQALNSARDVMRERDPRVVLLGEDGGKLSKRGGAPTLRGLRQDGIEPEALLGYLARLGSPDAPEPLPLGALAASFDLARLSHAPPRFDGAQLLTLNRRALHALRGQAARHGVGRDLFGGRSVHALIEEAQQRSTSQRPTGALAAHRLRRPDHGRTRHLTVDRVSPGLRGRAA